MTIRIAYGGIKNEYRIGDTTLNILTYICIAKQKTRIKNNNSKTEQNYEKRKRNFDREESS